MPIDPSQLQYLLQALRGNMGTNPKIGPNPGAIPEAGQGTTYPPGQGPPMNPGELPPAQFFKPPPGWTGGTPNLPGGNAPDDAIGPQPIPGNWR